MAQTVRDGERKQTNLAFKGIREELIQVQEGNGNLNDAICDVCFIRTLSSVGVNIALYLCYICNTYLCQDCFKGHESHSFFKKSEKERIKKCFCDEMMNEIKSERTKKLDREEVSFVDSVNVKHELDKSDCWISGLCGLDDTRSVVCDLHNHCIKVFSIGSHILQRYIRFGYVPFGVTEIRVKRETTEQVVMPASVSSDIDLRQLKPLKHLRAAFKTFFSVNQEPTEQVVVPTSDIFTMNQSKQCLLAVTLPGKRKILIINLTQNPAEITKSIKTRKYCWSIDFSEAKIFTVCSDDDVFRRGYGRWFVSVMSTDGVTIQTIKTDLHIWSVPNLAVCHGRVYITDPVNNKVLCMNDKGKFSYKTREGSRPEGITIDADTKTIYICAWGHDKLYRLNSRLEYLSDLKSIDSKWPSALCVYRERLYVGHGWGSTSGNFVTVVRVL